MCTNYSLEHYKNIIKIDNTSGYLDVSILYGDVVYHIDYLCSQDVCESVFRIIGDSCHPLRRTPRLTLKDAYITIYKYLLYNILSNVISSSDSLLS